MKIRPKLAYTGAALTIAAAVLVPFVLINFFAHRVNALGLHVDEGYVAGPVVRTIDKADYTIAVHREFHPRFLQRQEPFVQLAWEPAKSLPAVVSDDVDIDGDGTPDVHVSFAVAKEAQKPTTVNVASLNPRFIALQNVGEESFSRMIVRIGDRIIVRIPVKRAGRSH